MRQIDEAQAKATIGWAMYQRQEVNARFAPFGPEHTGRACQ